jgi:hypothetical protein
VDPASGSVVHCLVHFCLNAIEAGGFAIFQFVNSSIDLCKCDGGVKFRENGTLVVIGKDCGINRAMIVEHPIKIGAKHSHVLLAIGSNLPFSLPLMSSGDADE